MSVELNCTQGGQSSLLWKRSIELVELFPWQPGAGPHCWGRSSVTPSPTKDPKGPGEGPEERKLSDLGESEFKSCCP